MAKLNDNFTLRAPVPVDDKLGWWDEAAGAWKPFTSRQDAIDKTPHYRFRTMTLPVEENGDVVEYWFKMGVQDEDLVLKTSQADLSNYYTKTELQTSGQSQVHWDNITNVPDLSVTWENITGDQSVIGNSGFTNDAGYITAADLPIPLTFENGLREDSGVVKLGLDLTTVGTTNEGLLTESTYLVYGDILNDFSSLQFQTGLDSNPSVILSARNSLHQFSIGIDGEKLAIEKGDISTSSFQSIRFSTNNFITISDGINNKGLQYNADYSAVGALDPRWIPDWGAVTDYVADNALTFENGLREDGGVVKLGLDLTTIGTTNKGLLTEQTSLVLGDLLSQNITAFNLYDNASLSIQKSISGIGTQSIEFSGPDAIVPNTMLIIDAVNEKGLEELADYSSNKTQYSYVTLKMLNEVAGDIPDLTGYATETWVISQGYLTSVPWSFNVNNGDLTINGVTNNLDGRWLERSEGVITSGYGITVNGDLATGMGIELDTTVVDNRYLRKDVNDLTINSLSVGGNFGVAGNTELQGLVYFNALITGTTSDQMLVRDPVSNLVKYINMPSFGGEFTVANNAGTPQFTVANGQSLRINATGDASVAFNAGTKTITINSSGGSSGGGVDSWNARTGAVVPESGDYTTAQVTESGNLYFTEARVLGTDLAGFTTGSNASIAASDTVLQAFSKVQGQINARVPTSRTVSISGTSGNITVSGATTQNLGSNASWTINLPNKGTAGTYTKVTTDAQGRVSSGTSLSLGDMPNGVIQSLSLGSIAGNLSISDGNSVTLNSISRRQVQVFEDLGDLGVGIFGISNTTGQTGYPALGQGIFSKRGGNNTGAFILWNRNNANYLEYNTGSNDVWNGWEVIASRSWVTSQIPTDYVNTTSTQTGIAGNKSWTGAHNWSSSTNPSSVANTATIGGTASGQFLRLTELGSSNISAILRGYASNGVQMLLNQGGIDVPVTAGNFTAGPYFAGGVPILATNTGGSVAVGPHGSGNIYLRPSGVNSSTGQIYIQPDGTTVVTGLSGSGNQMVVASPSGVLSRQAIPAVQTLYSAGSIGQYGISGGNAIYIQALGNAESLNANVDNIELVQSYFQPFRMTASAADYSSVFTGFRSMRQSNASVSYGFDMGMNFTGSLNGKIAVRRYTGSSWTSLEALATENWVKSWGLGTFTNNNGTVADANTPSETQFFSGGASTTNRPPGTGHTYLHIGRGSTIAHQLAFDYDNNEMYLRRLRTSWMPWYKLWHDGNFDPSTKQNTITGGASTITTSNLTANRALISNGSGKVAVSAVTSTELGYLDGVTSSIQTQLNGKAPTTHNHTWSQLSGGSTSLIPGAGAVGTYGSLTISGSKTSYSGIEFTGTTNTATFMIRNSDNLSGLYSGGWIWQFDGSGTLATGTVPWSNISGQVSVTAGNGLTGGGALSSSRTITLGTPGTITGSSTNSVSTSSHTHALTLVSADITGALGFTPVTTARTITMVGGNGITSSAGAQTLAGNRSWTISLTAINAGSTSVGAVRYNGTSRTAGSWYGGTTSPASNTRLNYDGIIHAYDFVGYGTSDARLKEQITPISNPLEKLSQIGGYSFKWKDGHDSYHGNDYGVIAQEVEKVLPEIVSERGGVKAIKTGNQLTGLLIAGFNELVKRVEALENGLS